MSLKKIFDRQRSEVGIGSLGIIDDFTTEEGEKVKDEVHVALGASPVGKLENGNIDTLRLVYANGLVCGWTTRAPLALAGAATNWACTA